MASRPRQPGYQDVQPIVDLVTDQECADAKEFRARTDERIGELQSDRDYFEYMIGAAEAVAALYSEERSVDKRKWEAKTSPQWLKQLEQWRETSRAFLVLKAKRETAQIKIDIWRTLHADRRGDGAQPWPGSDRPNRPQPERRR